MDWTDGQQRRAWLDRQDAKLRDALSYYLGPAAEPVNALANVASWLSPGSDMMDAANASRDLMASKTPGNALTNAGWLTASLAGMALPGNAGALRGAADDASEAGIRAYHGSPHDFDAFDLSKIGAGEGAQAYGHGLYFADAEDVAKTYRDKLKGADGGHMYEVHLKANPDDFLDWDKPLSSQSETVRNAVTGGVDPFLGGLIQKEPGGKAHQTLRDLAAKGKLPGVDGGDSWDKSEAVSAYLADKGVPGIRYLDQASRATGEGTRNYVVFDPATIEIMRKYGLLGGIGLGGAVSVNSLANPQPGERY